MNKITSYFGLTLQYYGYKSNNFFYGDNNHTDSMIQTSRACYYLNKNIINGAISFSFTTIVSKSNFINDSISTNFSESEGICMIWFDRY